MRIKNSLSNTISNLVSFLLVLILTMIMRSVFFENLGSEYFGLNALVANYLTLLSLAELGLGVAVVYSFYKPISDNDMHTISCLLRFYKKIYKIIAATVLVLGIILLPLFFMTVKGGFGFETFAVIFLLYLFNAVASYLIAYKRSFLYALQKSYLMVYPDLIFKVMNVLCQIYILNLEVASDLKLYLFSLSLVFFTVLSNVYIHVMVQRNYRKYFYSNDELDKEIKAGIKRKVIGVVYHKIGDILINYTDYIVITLMVGLSIVGIVSNYLLIVSSIVALVSKIFDGLTASFGDLIAENNKAKTNSYFEITNLIIFIISTNVFVGIMFGLDDFISLWMGEVNTLESSIVPFIAIAVYLQLFRIPVGGVKTAGGIFEQDKFIPILEACIYLTFSLLLVAYYGTVGIFLAKIITSIVLSNWVKAYYLYSIILKTSFLNYLKVLFKYVMFTLFIYLVLLSVNNYLFTVNSWQDLFLKMFTVFIFMNLIILFLISKSKVFIDFVHISKRR